MGLVIVNESVMEGGIVGQIQHACDELCVRNAAGSIYLPGPLRKACPA